MDFAALVLGPALACFGDPITVMPASGTPSYSAAGIFRAQPTDVALGDGTILSSTTYTLGIRLSDFAVPIVPDDKICVGGVAYWVDHIHVDGQGGATLTLKKAPS